VGRSKNKKITFECLLKESLKYEGEEGEKDGIFHSWLLWIKVLCIATPGYSH
jgi:hypothetical protein